MPYYESNGKGELVPIKGGVDESVVQAIERYDDDSIVRAMTSGVAAEEYIYRYTISTATGPKEIIGISTEGSNQLANMIGNLEVLNDARIDKDSDPDYIYAMLRVKNLERNTTLLGVGRQCKFVQGKNNVPMRDRNDEHAFVKAISKAQRNGVLHHASEEVVIKIVNTWAKTGKQARINPPSVQTDRIAAPVKQAASVQREVVQKPDAPAIRTAAASPIAGGISADAVSKQMEKLVNLRNKVYKRFSEELHYDTDAMSAVIKEKFGTESGLSGLNEAQLNESLALIDEILNAMAGAVDGATDPEKAETVPPASTPAATPQGTLVDLESVAKNLGFAGKAEQDAIRGRLFDLLTKKDLLGMTVEQAKQWIGKYGLANSKDGNKDTIQGMIKDATEALEALKGTGDNAQAPLI